jgi:apolipoprotein N-acyltransferase
MGPRRLVLAMLGGLLVGLAFPRPGWGPLIVPGVASAFFLAASADGPWRAAREGGLFGFVATLLTLRWFATPILLFSTLGASIAWTAVVLSALTLGLLWAGMFALQAAWARRWGAATALALAPLLLTAYDLVREWFPFPFPWGSAAAALVDWPWILDLAGAVGAAGVSYLLYALGAILAGAVLLPRRRTLRCAALWLGALAFALVLVPMSIPSLAGSVRVAVVQASLPRDAAATEEWHAYRSLTAEAARAGAELVVWPESAVSYQFHEDGKWAALLGDLAALHRVDLVVGGLTRSPSGKYENSSVLVRADRGMVAKAPKRQLVPFGEYMPLRWLFGRIPALANEVGEFEAGANPVVFEGRRIRVGPLVCFEAVFPGLGLDLVHGGAQLLVNQTNDSWFGSTGGPEQHLDHALLRSAETGLPMARAANSGISALIRGGGAVEARLETGARGILVADLPFPDGYRTGVIGGRAVAWTALILTAGLAAGIVPRRRAAPTAADTPSENPPDA